MNVLSGLQLGTNYTQKLCRKIDVLARCAALTPEKCKGLVGLHAFSGADWAGKFAGISKKKWLECFLALEKDSEIVQVFQHLGDKSVNLNIHMNLLEEFTCTGYAKQRKYRRLNKLRWELFKTQNLEAEKLPPTLGAFEPHVKRAHLIAIIDKGYKVPKPLEETGWEKSEDDIILPVRSLRLPAPQAIVEIVKCGCRGQCSTNRCSCIKLNCLALLLVSAMTAATFRIILPHLRIILPHLRIILPSFVEEGDLE